MGILNMYKQKDNEKGQVLLFVIVTMTIALALVSEITTRNLSSTSQTTSTDSFQRVSAAAESGAETFLKYSDNELEDRVGDTNILNYRPSQSGNTDDPINTQAEVTVERYGATPAGEQFYVLIMGEAVSVNLNDYSGSSIKVCWKDSAAAVERPADISTDLKYFIWGKQGSNYNTKVGGIKAFDHPQGAPLNYTSNFDSSTREGELDCHTISGLPAGAKEMHLTSLNGNSDVYITPIGSALPFQGYKITSIGSIANNPGEASKKISVYRSLSFIPGIFDYAIYSHNGAL